MRTQVSQVLLSNEKLVQEYRDHIRLMQTATANCEMVTAEKESRTTMQQQDISHVEAQLYEHRAICEGACAAATRYTLRARILCCTSVFTKPCACIVASSGELGY